MAELEILDFANGGYGISHLNGKVVFVEYALPGEVVLAEIIAQKKSYAFAKAKEVLKPSKYRIRPKCKYYFDCGGCDLQHADYGYQLRLKQHVFVSTLRRIGGIELQGHPEIVKSDKQWNYRKRVNFRCFRGWWGYFKRSSREFVAIDNCPVADERINEFIKANRCKGESMFVHADDFGHINEDEMMLDLKLGQPLFFRSDSFTQVNREVNLRIVDDLVSVVGNLHPKSIVEFFCGIGNFTVPLALNGYKIFAVEYSNSAISSLRRNVNTFNLKSVDIVKRDLMQPFRIRGGFDVAILDPPREGAKCVAQWLLKRNIDYVIYISCEPATLARDLKILMDKYCIKKVKLYDMFPQTHHVESMTVLKLK